jgi:trk system potassium uptake protein TrkH
VHYKVIKTRGKSLLKDLQFQIIISVIAIVTLLLCLVSTVAPIDMLFTVVSAITTTGASVAAPNVMAGWPSFVIVCLMCLMITGGSNGSTVGAIKLVRMITYFKGIYRHIREILSPDGRVVPVTLHGHTIPEKAIAQAGNFITLYMMFIMFTWALFCLFGYDPFRSLFAAMTLQGNNGLELGIITPTLNPVLKLVSIFDMWTGRIEIYPVLITLRAGFEIFKR